MSFFSRIFSVAIGICCLMVICSAWAQQTDPAAIANFMRKYQSNENSFARFRFTTNQLQLPDPNINFWAGQLAAADASIMGRPNDALLYFPVVTPPPKSLPDPAHYQAVGAREWIVSQAPHYRIVMINEAHHLPQTRLLTLSLLKPLHDAGFHYLALETLVNDGKNPVPAGYPETTSGEYTKEPIMADLVREALRLGYTLVPFEAVDTESLDVPARESTQASNLQKFLDSHPDARLLVHAGYAHVAKTEAVTIAGARTMATSLAATSHAPILSVDQTELTPMSKASHEAINAQSVLSKEFATTGPVVFLERNHGTAWSSKPGAYDASVLLPPFPANIIRPDWLSLSGARRKVFVGAAPCAGRFPCLVQAFVMGESHQAIPADQFVVLLPSEDRIPLFLRDGVYRLRYTALQDQVVFERRIDVPDRLGELPPERIQR